MPKKPKDQLEIDVRRRGEVPPYEGKLHFYVSPTIKPSAAPQPCARCGRDFEDETAHILPKAAA